MTCNMIICDFHQREAERQIQRLVFWQVSKFLLAGISTDNNTQVIPLFFVVLPWQHVIIPGITQVYQEQ